MALLPFSILGSAAAVGTGVSGKIEAGTTLDKFPFAQSVGGVTVRIRTDQRVLVGDLIAVQADGIIVL